MVKVTNQFRQGGRRGVGRGDKGGDLMQLLVLSSEYVIQHKYIKTLHVL